MTISNELVWARAALVAIILVFVPGLLDPFDTPKAIVLRVVGVSALAGALLHASSGLGHARTKLRDVLARQPHAVAADASIASWALVACASTAYSVSPRLSVIGELQQREGLLTTLALVGVYAMMRRSHPSAADVRVTLDLVLASAAIAAAYAVLQFAGLDPLAWAGVTHSASGGGDVLRAFGTLGNPILLAAVLAPALGMVTVRLATGSGPVRLWIALFGLLAIGLMVTLSRGAWLSGACAVIAAMVGAVWHRDGRAVRPVMPALLSAMVAPALFGLWFLRGPAWARATESLVVAPGSALVRREIADGALALWRGQPWLGTGPDTFGLMFPSVQPLAYGGGLWHGLPIQAHSVVLQVLATTGALGALSGVLCIAALLAMLRVRQSKGSAGSERLEPLVGCAGLMVFGIFNHVGIAGAALFMALSAMLVRTGVDAQAGGEPARARSSALFTFALAIGIAWSAMPEVKALAAAGRARSALEQSVVASEEQRRVLVGEAARQGAEAVRHAPGEDELWRLACEGELALGREAIRTNDLASAGAAFARAEAHARRAVELEPLRATNSQSLGNALALRGRLSLVAEHPAAEVAAWASGSDSAFAEARRLAPRDARILIDEARAELELHRAVAARTTAQRIVQLYPDAATGHSLVAAAQLMLGERAAAAQSLRAAVRGRWMEARGADERAARAYLRILESADSAR